MAKTAQDTFVAQLKDGSSLRVQRGSTWPDRHEVVQLDGGRGHLFKDLDLGEEEPAPKSAAKAGPAKAAPKAEAEAAPARPGKEPS
jgi:hypothetical protein